MPTGIEWTEETWNPWVGCDIVSEGCRECYAMKMASRLEHGFHMPSYAGTTQKVNGRVVWSGAINRATDKAFHRPARKTVPVVWFVNSMSDFWHPAVHPHWRYQAVRIMIEHGRHEYQVLTKRPENMKRMIAELEALGAPLPPNFWCGVTVENGKHLERIDLLREIDVPIRFLSIEPLIGDIGTMNLDGISWAIIGGESGPRARPCHAEWVRSALDQCRAAGVPVFMKQWGHWRNNPLAVEGADKGEDPAAYVDRNDPVGKGGSLIDGVAWKQYPLRRGSKVRHIAAGNRRGT